MAPRPAVGSVADADQDRQRTGEGGQAILHDGRLIHVIGRMRALGLSRRDRGKTGKREDRKAGQRGFCEGHGELLRGWDQSPNARRDEEFGPSTELNAVVLHHPRLL